jgi:F-type H+-transporting ATPase subunit delta
MSFVLRPLSKINKSNGLSAFRFISRAMSSEMSFTFASPGEVFYNQATNVKQVDVPTLSGSFGIIANHVPTLAVLKPGVVTVIENEGKTQKFFVSSGSVTVNADSSVQLLAEEAFAVDKLDLKSAQDALAEAQRELSSAGGDELKKAEAQISIETAEAIVRAIQTGI